MLDPAAGNPSRASVSRRPGALLASAPVFVAYASLMDYYVSGLVTGATKY